mmetsp:Transcript_7530/g.22433  ORF Transcript_7530/g.22433 Transcript_7530/m.22433 type:complete len:141 (-) Transcript_7530:206-628(-)
MSTSRSSLWKIDDPVDGIVRMTPFKVVKIHQKYIKRNTAGRKKLEQELAQMREQLDDLVERANGTHDYATYVDEENCTIQQNFKAIVVAITANELKHDKRLKALEQSVKSLEQQYKETISRLAIRRGPKAKDEHEFPAEW